jgi:hypothetical protein
MTPEHPQPKAFPEYLDKPSAERATCYRAYAEQMRAVAGAALTQETRAGYLQMAQEWLALASRIDDQHVEVTVNVDPELASILRRT